MIKKCETELIKADCDMSPLLPFHNHLVRLRLTDKPIITKIFKFHFFYLYNLIYSSEICKLCDYIKIVSLFKADCDMIK